MGQLMLDQWPGSDLIIGQAVDALPSWLGFLPKPKSYHFTSCLYTLNCHRMEPTF